MDLEILRESIKNQFQRCFEMLGYAAEHFPIDKWRRCSNFRPAGTAYHTLETIDFYFSEQSVEEFKWGYRFNGDWEGAEDEQLPEQEDILQYLGEMKHKTTDWLATSLLLGQETKYPWTGSTVLERSLYVFRHTQYNTGQLSGCLLSQGHEGIAWR